MTHILYEITSKTMNFSNNWPTKFDKVLIRTFRKSIFRNI